MDKTGTYSRYRWGLILAV